MFLRILQHLPLDIRLQSRGIDCDVLCAVDDKTVLVAVPNLLESMARILQRRTDIFQYPNSFSENKRIPLTSTTGVSTTAGGGGVLHTANSKFRGLAWPGVRRTFDTFCGTNDWPAASTRMS